MADRPDPAGVAAVFRAESGRALATIARLTRDLSLAEDAVQEAFVAALDHWPRAGVPQNPGAWITTTARNRALDVLRREGRRPELERRAVDLERVEVLECTPPVLHAVADDQLLLMFTCCHPALSPEVRITLTLRMACGLRAAEIARALLQTEDAVARRLHRAKAKIRDSAIPIRVPPPELLGERVPSVLECVYLTFSEGYAATRGEELIRHELCDEAIRLGRVLVELMPRDPGAQALLALMLLQDSRRSARLGEHGELVLLEDQDRSVWDAERIEEGLAWLDRATSHGEMSRAAASYLLQAALAAEHARAHAWEATDWPAIVRHYDQLLALTASPVVAVNRAVAVSFADGPAAAVPLLTDLAGDPRLDDGHLVPAALADLHRRLGDVAAARRHYETRSPVLGPTPSGP
jgi:RNA polymerase sigma-70 factor, ECF subfamily